MRILFLLVALLALSATAFAQQPAPPTNVLPGVVKDGPATISISDKDSAAIKDAFLKATFTAKTLEVKQAQEDAAKAKLDLASSDRAQAEKVSNDAKDEYLAIVKSAAKAAGIDLDHYLPSEKDGKVVFVPREDKK